ncbi:17034_t:CDS:1, partial [Acaulospora colombiana]
MRSIPSVTGSNRKPLGRRRHQEASQVPYQASQYSLEIDDKASDTRQHQRQTTRRETRSLRSTVKQESE